jgi:hypothetical protein
MLEALILHVFLQVSDWIIHWSDDVEFSVVIYFILFYRFCQHYIVVERTDTTE